MQRLTSVALLLTVLGAGPLYPAGHDSKASSGSARTVPTDAERLTLPPLMRFAPLPAQATRLAQHSCIGTLLRENVLLTAAHCFSEIPATLLLECRFATGVPEMRTVPVERVDFHETADVALLHWHDQKPCSSRNISVESPSKSESTPLFSVSFDEPGDTVYRTFQVAILSEDEWAIVVEDEDACLIQSHSGYPFFRLASSGTARLDAMLISGTLDCPSVQVLVRLAPIQEWMQERLQ